MMRRLRAAAVAAALAAASVLPPVAQAAAPVWEQADGYGIVAAPDDSGISIAVADGYLWVRLARPMQVKLFTILGQPVAQASLPSGASRLKLPASGIYILKAGTVTKRITVQEI